MAGCGGSHFAVGVGVAPVCPYGYYETPPYACAPDGYYGPDWFSGGVFIGAGPWYHGRDHFYGHVDHNLDIRKGYHGALPARGKLRRHGARNSMARRCMTRADTKLHEADSIAGAA